MNASCKILFPIAMLNLVGCTLLSSVLENTIEAPTVVCDEVRVSSVSLSGVDLVFSINAYNPNPIGLDVEQVEYSVAVDGNLVGQGESLSGVTLAARDDSEFELAFSVSFSDLVGLGINAVSGGHHTVALDSVVHVSTPIGDMPVRVGHSVDLDF